MENYQDSSLSHRVYQKIRNDILERRYKENEELKESTLGNELGVSRTPVREALRQLELEGLVTIVPNKGAYVTGITAKDVKDIYAIRSTLEGLVVRWAIEHITPQQIDELEEILMLSEYHLKRESSAEQIMDLDGKFHSILYEASGSRMLRNLMSGFHDYVKSTRMNSVVTEDRARRSIREHRQILKAIQEEDVDMAEQLANEHIWQVIHNLRKYGYEH